MTDKDCYDCDDWDRPGRICFCILHIWNYREWCVGCQIDENNFADQYPMLIPHKNFHGADGE